MKKKIGVMVLLLVLAVSFCIPAGYADPDRKCSKCSKKSSHSKKMDLDKKFYYKAHLILKNEKELGLSEKQVDQIKKLKISTKKDLISRQAQIDLIAVDIKSEMWEDPMDVAAINALIERKYGLKKGKAQSIVSALAKLKKILSEKQKEMLKELY
jgi:hypothetical protein